MPELPDVEYFKGLIERHALGKNIVRAEVSDARILATLSARTLSRRIEGARLVTARRHGKHLMAKVDKGGWLTFHFGLTGGLHFFRNLDALPPFTRVRFDFADGGHLGYSNKRMIGHVGLVEDAADFIAAEKLGPDALDPRLDFPAFKAAIARTKRDIKSALMDQGLIAGIGNIYSDEILFQAGVHPKTRVDKLDAGRLNLIYRKTRSVLETAIERGTGSEQFTARAPKGSLLPERKKGGCCPRCGDFLKTLKVSSRTAYYCARCQS